MTTQERFLIEPVYAKFGAWVRRQRKDLNWTQEDLGLRVGYGRSAISQIEGGQQRIPLHLAVQFQRQFEAAQDARLAALTLQAARR